MSQNTDVAPIMNSRTSRIANRSLWRLLPAAACVAGVLLTAATSGGADGAANPANAQPVAQADRDSGAAPKNAAVRAPRKEGHERIVLAVGTSTVIDSKEALTRASVAAPEVAEVTILSPLEVLVTGKGLGSTQIILWDQGSGQSVFDVMVEPDLAQLRSAIAQAAPNARIEVQVVRDAIILSGEVADTDTATRVFELAKLISPAVHNQIKVAGEQQVLLRCTVAEVNKRGLRELGVNGWLGGDNLHDIFAVNQIGGINPVNIGAARGFGPIGGAHAAAIPFGTDQDEGLPLRTSTNFSLGFPRVQMQLFFKAMRENSLLKVLAEPNLIALNGKEAHFVAGGEFPVPIPQGVSGAVTIEFKEFGIRLSFTPTVVGKQMIRLKVQPEVSELDYTSSVQFSGYVVPGLTKRSAETTIELATGTTIAIAGLLSENVRGVSSKLPGLGDVPVLGALFSSVSYQKNVSELVILVTPELVSAMNPDQVPPVPGQFKTDPNDWQLFGLGMVEGEPACDMTTSEQALDTPLPTGYRKYHSPPQQMSVHGPWGPADAAETRIE